MSNKTKIQYSTYKQYIPFPLDIGEIIQCCPAIVDVHFSKKEIVSHNIATQTYSLKV